MVVIKIVIPAPRTNVRGSTAGTQTSVRIVTKVGFAPLALHPMQARLTEP